MKKLILTTVLGVLGLVLSAQNVTSTIMVNSTDPVTGLRSLGTDMKTVRNGMTDEHPLELGLAAVETPEGWMYSLTVTVAELVSRPLPEKGLLLLKTTTGEVIELTNHMETLQSQDFEGDAVPGSSVLVYHNRGGYSVTMEQLMKLGREGVQKLRIQTPGGYHETIYKKDLWRSVISAHVNAIHAEIKNKKDIRADF